MDSDKKNESYFTVLLTFLTLTLVFQGASQLMAQGYWVYGIGSIFGALIVTWVIYKLIITKK